jgi:hypothetical protein
MAPAMLYHYTCVDHGKPGIDRDGELRGNTHSAFPELGPVVWLTDISEIADPAAIGFARREDQIRLKCDRTAVRYDVRAVDCPDLKKWTELRGKCKPLMVAILEEFGSWARWWVSPGPIPISRTEEESVERG